MGNLSFPHQVLDLQVERSTIALLSKLQYYSGKHKRHTLKAQLIIDYTQGQFLSVAFGKGRIHDLRLLEHSQVRFHPDRLCLADKGYQGITKIHANSIIPQKKKPRQSLEKAYKQANRARFASENYSRA